jgi:predicted dehydrogenase
MRFGLVGTNFITDRLMCAGKMIPDFEAVAVGSRSEDTGRAFADKYGIEHVFTDFEAMAKSGLLDAVYIATPNYCHAKIANIFLKEGVNVFCEKPFAANAKEVESMIENSEKSGAFLMEAIKNIYMPAFEAIKAEFPRIGQIRRAILSMNRFSSRYDLYLEGKNPNTFRKDLANGAIMDMGVYNIQLAVALFGSPKKITATGVLLEDGKGVDGVCTVILTYDKFECVCMTSKVNTSHLHCEIGGEQGSVTFTMSSELEKLKGWDNKGNSWDIEVDGKELEANLYYELVRFIEHMKNPDPAFAEKVVWQEREVIRILDEARRQIGLVFDNDLQEMF